MKQYLARLEIFSILYFVLVQSYLCALAISGFLTTFILQVFLYLHLFVILFQRDKELMDTRERYTELEEKLENMGSTLEAYGHSSESEVIHRLQSEV